MRPLIPERIAGKEARASSHKNSSTNILPELCSKIELQEESNTNYAKVLIPIRKNEAWWALAQDERRAIFEERSHHIAIGLEYTCPPSPGDFITAMTSASPLIFLRGLSTRQRTLTLSKGLCTGSGKLRSGAMSIAK